MSRNKYDIKRVSQETLEKVCEEILSAYVAKDAVSVTFFLKWDGPVNPSVGELIKQAIIPLRTKAEVERHILDVVRKYMTCASGLSLDQFIRRLRELSNEEVSY